MAIPGSSNTAAPPDYAWYRDLNGYQWFVVAVAAVGWMFDTMAQQLFNLARVPALRDLMGGSAAPGAVAQQAGISTMVFMIGWGLGGIVFGILGVICTLPKTIYTDGWPLSGMAKCNIWRCMA